MKRMRSTLEKRYDTDFNPRSPCGERRDPSEPDGLPSFISTHAPHAGSDQQAAAQVAHAVVISTHAPHAGSD